MTRQVIVEADVAAEIERIDDWWRLHRDKHPTLFTAELAAAFRRIAALPAAGKAVARTTIKGVRRVLLPGCRSHLYYRYSQTQVQVLAIWSAQHEHQPDL